jgi:hypothetical protein
MYTLIVEKIIEINNAIIENPQIELLKHFGRSANGDFKIIHFTWCWVENHNGTLRL